jgi:pyridoxine kinase
MRGILSIHSEVVYGHVGNAAARFGLQRLGAEVWPVPTVLYSNHPGHGRFAGETVPASQCESLIDALNAQGRFAQCDGVLTGYFREGAQVEAAARAVDRVKAANSSALFCCDPVMGDADKGLYVPDGVPSALRDLLLPRCDTLTPNAFELGQLTGAAITDVASAVDAARSLERTAVVCTSVPTPIETRIGTVLVTDRRAWSIEMDRVEGEPHGLGDLLSALFLGHLVLGRDAPAAFVQAISSVDGLMRASVRDGSDEMLLIQEQNRLVTPDLLRPIEIR